MKIERLFVFFFSSRRRHTRWPRDWSSDVCSSDLRGPRTAELAEARPLWPGDPLRVVLEDSRRWAAARLAGRAGVAAAPPGAAQGRWRDESLRVALRGRLRPPGPAGAARALAPQGLPGAAGRDARIA